MNFFARKIAAPPVPVEAPIAAEAPVTAPPEDAPVANTPSAITYSRIDLHTEETATGATPLAPACSGEDYEEFITYLRVGKRPYRRTGVSVKEEFDRWFADRVRVLNPIPERKASGLSRLLQVRGNLD